MIATRRIARLVLALIALGLMAALGGCSDALSDYLTHQDSEGSDGSNNNSGGNGSDNTGGGQPSDDEETDDPDVESARS